MIPTRDHPPTDLIPHREESGAVMDEVPVTASRRAISPRAHDRASGITYRRAIRKTSAPLGCEGPRSADPGTHRPPFEGFGNSLSHPKYYNPRIATA